MAKIQKREDKLPTRGPGDDDKPRRKPSYLFETDEQYQDFSRQLDKMLGVPDYADDEED